MQTLAALSQRDGKCVRAGDYADAQCTDHHAAVRGLQRAQVGVAGQERRCVCAARVRGKTPSRYAATAEQRPVAVINCSTAMDLQAQAWFRAAGAVSRSAPRCDPLTRIVSSTVRLACLQGYRI